MSFPIIRDLVIPQGTDFDETYTWWLDAPDEARDRGDWGASTTYYPRDLAVFASVVYAATVRNVGEEPDGSGSWTALTPVDLTGWSARTMARERLTDDPVLDLTDVLEVDGSGLILGDTAGTIELKIANTRTTGLPDMILKYDLELVSPGGLVTRFMQGRVVPDPEVTYG